MVDDSTVEICNSWNKSDLKSYRVKVSTMIDKSK